METHPTALVHYPETDGQPMTESDPTRDYLIYCVETLRTYFEGRPNTYVSGNLFIYYQEGDAKKVISPDVFVIFGVSKYKRRSYKAWQEGGKLPSFIIEITSLTTRKQDEVEKPELYASLGVQEYFQYDPTGDYLMPQLKGSRLVNGQYQSLPLECTPDGISFIHSQELGLDLQLRVPTVESLMTPARLAPVALELRFYDARSNSKLLSYRELLNAQEQTEAERLKAQQALQSAIAHLKATGLSSEQIAEILNLPFDQIN
jgi:Uma2 family endonuclease